MRLCNEAKGSGGQVSRLSYCDGHDKSRDESADHVARTAGEVGRAGPNRK